MKTMTAESITKLVPQMADYFTNADHVDIRSIDSSVSMREFIAGMLAYYPGWLKVLYKIRLGFVRLLGIGPSGIPEAVNMSPEDVPMLPGASASFFTVKLAQEDRVWVAGATESHLTAYLGVVMERVSEENRFHLLTIVHYHRWTGPVYFNVIRPFEHIVMIKMGEAGAAGSVGSRCL